LKSDVKVLDRVLITDLITTDGNVNGAVGFNTRTGEFYLFKSGAVVVAAGGFSGGGLGNWPSFTGDGVAMGARAGAELRHMEFGKTEVAGILPDRGWPHWVFRLLNPQEEEVTITNAKGEEFLEKYELGRRLKGRKYYGAPWRVHLMAIFQEFKEGKGPCYVDYRAPNKASRLRDFWGSYFDRTLKQIELTGTTLDQIKYEIAISRGFSQGGGIRINARGESTVPGLYAGGQASDMCGTAQYTIVSGMMASMITAQGAGESAAKYALNQPSHDTDKDQVEDLRTAIYAPLIRKKGIRADDMRQKMTKAWVNVDIRDENRLSKAHRDFQALENETSNLRAEDLHELAKCHKISNYVMCSDAVAVSALARRETRLEHIRQDYPLTDNKEWLKWVIVRRVGEEFNTYLEDIPIQRWRYRPEPIIFNRLEPKGKE
jgi:succinate dehydrogenase/fumarate reductase flavoprotein subunit